MVNGGLDFRRFDQVLAVLSKHANMKMWNQDARVNVLGGARATEPTADAAMAAAIICSYYDVQMPVDMVFIGEVDLGGMVSKDTRAGSRLLLIQFTCAPCQMRASCFKMC
jgi:DNA repair protein RadA/Sms